MYSLVTRYLEGLAYLSLERYDEAGCYIQQSLAIARQASDIRTEGMSLTWLGAVADASDPSRPPSAHASRE